MSRERVGGLPALPRAPLFVEGLDEAPSGRRSSDRAARSPAPVGGPSPSTGLPPFRHLAREAADVLEVGRVGLWALGENGEVVCLTRFDRASLKQEDNRRYPAELGEALRFLLERAAVLAMNDTRSSRGTAGPLHDWLREEGIRALLVLPVRLKGRFAGWLTFEENERPRRWTDQDRSRALPFSGQLGGVLACWEPAGEGGANGAGAAVDPDGVAAGPAAEDVEPRSRHDPEARSAHAAGAPSGHEAGSPSRREPAGPPPGPPGRRSVRGRMRPLPSLEGAALLGGESAGELLHLLEVQSGYLALLDQVVQDDPADRELVEEARTAGDRVRDGLLTFLASLREGIPGREPLDLTEFLAGISGRLSRLGGDEVRLRLAPASRSLRVRGNPRLLERAMSHLVRNARDASPPGSAIRLSWGAWSPGEAESEVARVVVEDQGSGISPRDLPWIFEPFYTAGSDPAGPESSAGQRGGLGLPVVQAVVEGHGGWVDVESRPGEGTRVAIHLPLTAPALEAEPAAPEAAEEEPAEPARPRILVIEDEPMLARLLERILARNGFRVTLVEAPEDAAHAWRSLEGDVDLVIVERVLTGGRSGVAVTEPWRGEHPHLPLLVLDRTAAPSPADEEGPREVDGHPLLTKPFQPADVVAAVRRVLASREPRSDPSPDPPTGPSRGRRGGVVLH